MTTASIFILWVLIHLFFSPFRDEEFSLLSDPFRALLPFSSSWTTFLYSLSLLSMIGYWSAEKRDKEEKDSKRINKLLPIVHSSGHEKVSCMTCFYAPWIHGHHHHLCCLRCIRVTLLSCHTIFSPVTSLLLRLHPTQPVLFFPPTKKKKLVQK